MATPSTTSIKSHEEHQTLISTGVNEIHIELDKILKVVVEGTLGYTVISLLIYIFRSFLWIKKGSFWNGSWR